ncbi:MAG: hypothetical protein M3M99_01380 [Actinomycetota bacterium]|nr:hypothetical protein [Actinomycetota bacterium]
MTTDSAAPPALERRYQAAIAIAFVAVTGMGLVVLSKRFGVEYPTIVDDWLYASQPDKSVGDLFAPFFESQGRYRPSYDLLSHAQWHTLGAPGEITGPNLWGAFRIALFAIALVVVPGILAATSRPRPGPALLAGLGIAAGLAIFASPITDVDFLRLGTQEPFLFGAPICGAALLLWATRRLIEGGGGRTLALTVTGLVVGYLLWALGIYYKEASLVVLVMAPFLYLDLDRRWRRGGVIDGPLWRSRPVQALAVAMALPVLHVAIGSAGSSNEGIGLYGAERPDSISGWLERLVDSADTVADTIDIVSMPAWGLFILALPIAIAALVAYRRTVPWLVIGFALTGYAILLFQGILLRPEGRYLIPGIALLAVAGFLLLAQAPPWVGWAAVVVTVVFAATQARDVSTILGAWANQQIDDNERTLDLVAELHPESCPTYMFNLGIEQGESFPQLVALRPGPLAGPCKAGSAGIIVGYKQDPGGPLANDDEVLRACAKPPGVSVIIQTPGYIGYKPLQVLSCPSFARELEGVPVADVLRRNRLVPGHGTTELRAQCAETYGEARCMPELRTAEEAFGTG